eukprot:GHVO01030032.1.p1 GENE.GHVO01030032.1~~GHVO01030032.1.p1  ORF type:complete len:161 (+),score=20.78 GHVO01030032.1:290-772(+)
MLNLAGFLEREYDITVYGSESDCPQIYDEEYMDMMDLDDDSEAKKSAGYKIGFREAYPVGITEGARVGGEKAKVAWCAGSPNHPLCEQSMPLGETTLHGSSAEEIVEETETEKILQEDENFRVGYRTGWVDGYDQGLSQYRNHANQYWCGISTAHPLCNV